MKTLAGLKYLCTFAPLLTKSTSDKEVLERWQSGRLRRSWKPLYCEVPGVRIPVSPLKSSCLAAFLLLWRAMPPNFLNNFWVSRGEVLEWLKRHAWKACIRQKCIAGSNPALSAESENYWMYFPPLRDCYQTFFNYVLIWNLVKTSCSLAKSSFHR